MLPMPDTEPTLMPAESEARTESTIMSLLLVLDDQRPWSTDELIRTIGRELDTRDAISNLHATGLVHRTTDGFVFATRAATHLDGLDM
jgi:predicted transcriptional regulator